MPDHKTTQLSVSKSAMLILPVLGILSVSSVPVESTNPVRGGEENSAHHLTMVKQRVDQIKTAWKTSGHTISKRSTTSTTTTTKADDLLLHSLASYCSNFRSDPDISSYFKQKAEHVPLKYRDISGHTGLHNWKHVNKGVTADVFPVHLQAQRNKNDVWLIFHVAHAENAIISRMDPFHYQDTHLNKPQEACQTIVSKARFLIGRNTSRETENGTPLTRFHMAHLVHGHSTVSIALDPFKSTEPTYLKSEDILLPKLRLRDSSSKGFLTLDHKKDTKINLVTDISKENSLSIRLVLWDWDLKKTLQTSAAVLMKPIHYNSYKYNVSIQLDDNSKHENEQLLSVHMMRMTKLDSNRWRVSLRIVLPKGNWTRSGKLTLSHTKIYPAYTSSLIRSLQVTRTLQLKLPDRNTTLPDRLIYFSSKQGFLCDGNGDKEESHPEFGANCTLHCQAFGRHISSIYISRRGSNPSPVVRSSSHVLPDQAVAMVDVGVASPDNQGAYQCTVVDDQGATASQGLQLFTSLFTEVRSFGLETSADQTTALLTCTAYGAEDMSLRISVSAQGKDQTRLDSDERFESNTTRGENHTTTLTLRVPWSELKIPRKSLTCLAKGQRGEKTQEIDLSFYPLNTQGVYPEFEHSLYDVELNQDDGTLNITCAAISKAPLEMNMAVDSLWRDTPLTEIYPDVVIAQETRGDTTTITAHRVPFKILRDHNEVQCVAAFGSIVATEKYRLIY